MQGTAEYLRSLNPAQLQAVTHDPSIPLQILAGPGSGKTRVLTCRVAHLVHHYSISPEDVCAVTFTNKAANEMKERLKKLIGPERTMSLVLGTFHAICAKLLRIYGTRIYLNANFSICDADESKRIIKNLLKPHLAVVRDVPLTLKPAQVLSEISHFKAKATTPAQAKLAVVGTGRNFALNAISENSRIIAEVYEEYAKELKSTNSLDFDDLLIFGVQLLKTDPSIVKNTRHVLVDEFQDTNAIQFELMELLASANKCISIVGDPDQSIYGWRSADVENLRKMKTSLPTTMQIFLEENYRSTAGILRVCLALISEDKKRIPKTLYTSHGNGPLPILNKCEDERVEAVFLAKEIRRLIAYSGGSFGYGDFVVLLRYNALSRTIETAFQREGIPHRFLGGKKFFERLEVKDLLAYLQVVDNPTFTPAFVRVVNTPKRGIGNKSVEELITQAKSNGISPMAMVEGIVSGDIPDTKPPLRKKVAPFVNVILELRKQAKKGEYADELIRNLLELIEYQEHLKSTQPDWETRWENVRELITFASQMELPTYNEDDESPPATDADLNPGPILGTRKNREGKWGVIIDTGSGSEEDTVQKNPTKVIPGNDGSRGSITPLRHFLESSMLSTDTQTAEEEANKPKVIISTCHAAKGLEWPVVFVPSVEGGAFPFARSEDHDEERRLLYVACTRAQGLLYLTHCRTRCTEAFTSRRDLSPFISSAIRGSQQDLVTASLPVLPEGDTSLIFKILQRPMPDSQEVQKLVAEFHETHPHYSLGPPMSLVEGLGSSSSICHAPVPGLPRLAPPASSELEMRSPIHSKPLDHTPFRSFNPISRTPQILSGFSHPSSALSSGMRQMVDRTPPVDLVSVAGPSSRKQSAAQSHGMWKEMRDAVTTTAVTQATAPQTNNPLPSSPSRSRAEATFLDGTLKQATKAITSKAPLQPPLAPIPIGRAHDVPSTSKLSRIRGAPQQTTSAGMKDATPRASIVATAGSSTNLGGFLVPSKTSSASGVSAPPLNRGRKRLGMGKLTQPYQPPEKRARQSQQ